MCKERRYDYIKLIDEIDDEEIKNIVSNIKDECPEKILNEDCKINEERTIWRFIRGKKDKYPYFINRSNVFKKRAREGKHKACMGCGLSVYLSKEATVSTINEKFPRQKFKIVKATYRPGVGDLYITGVNSEHCTFFPCEGFNHDHFFEIVDEDENEIEKGRK